MKSYEIKQYHESLWPLTCAPSTYRHDLKLRSAGIQALILQPIVVKYCGNTDLSIVKYLLGSLFTNFEAKDKVKGFPRSKLMNIYFKYILIDVDV